METTEFATIDYQAIDGDDDSYKETINPGADEYLYHKFLLLSSIDSNDVKRFRVKVAMSGSDSSPQNLDGGILYAWNGTNWVELVRNTNSSKTELTYSSAETEIAKQFVDSDDNYIRLLLRSRNRRDGARASFKYADFDAFPSECVVARYGHGFEPVQLSWLGED